MSLACRNRQPERMDDPAIDPVEHRRALAGLARINAVSGSDGVLWPAIRAFAREANRPIRVLDIATGRGDVPIALCRRAVRERIPIAFDGCDLSPTAVDEANRCASERQLPATFFPLNVLTDPLPVGYDVLTCSLFLHHLNDPDVIRLLRSMRDAGPQLILVNDLVRSPFNLVAVWTAARLLSRSPVVHEDGPLSVRAAFTPRELNALAETAGLQGAVIRHRFPCRLLLEWHAEQ